MIRIPTDAPKTNHIALLTTIVLLLTVGDSRAQTLHGMIEVPGVDDLEAAPNYVLRASRHTPAFENLRSHLCSSERKRFRARLGFLERAAEDRVAGAEMRAMLLNAVVGETVTDSLGRYTMTVPEAGLYVVWGEPTGVEDPSVGYWVFARIQLGTGETDRWWIHHEPTGSLESLCRMRE